MRVDYTSDIDEIYVDLAFRCCMGSTFLYVLSCVQHQTDAEVEHPASWAARWNLKFSNFRMNQMHKMGFDCCLMGETKQLYSVERLGKHLKVLGFPFDSVELSTPPLEKGDLGKASSNDPDNGFVNPVEV